MGVACSTCKTGSKSYDFSARAQSQQFNEASKADTIQTHSSATKPTKRTQDERKEGEDRVSKVDGSSSCKEIEVYISSGVVNNSKTGKSEEVENSKKITETSATDQVFKRESFQVASMMDSIEEFKPGHAARPNEDIVRAGHANVTNNSLVKLESMTDEEVDRTVLECWKQIEETCENERSEDVKVCSTTGWGVVRLFVSSTFTDYHAEREVLVKKVFPELREWCQGRHIQLIECDLRWGVPKYSTTEMTIKTCLGEVDKCKDETDGIPFFLNMLGERYGWMPCSSDVPHEIQTKYRWIFPASITHMEILHAAYRNHNPNAAFFIRDPAFLVDIPPEMQGAFVDNASLNKAQLKKLKEKLREWFPGQVFDYSCEYDGIDDSTGKSKVHLKGLEDFGNKVLEYFKSAIEKTFPVVEKELSPEEIELAAHDNFIRARGSLLLGRTSEVGNIMEYVSTGRLPGQMGDHGDGTIPLLLIQGLPGSGKSALMAYCTLQAKKLDCPLFYHFVGSGPGTSNNFRMANRLYSWLKQLTNYTDESVGNEDDNTCDDEDITLENMPEELKKLLTEAGKLDKNIVIILDAVNQLSDADTGSNHLVWLPTGFPTNVYCIVSVVRDSRSANLLLSQSRSPRPLELHIGELDSVARREIVEHILGIYNKKLDDQQMELLINAEGAYNPLWLSLSCEELRVFGVFEKVTDHIKSLPGFLKGLLQFILTRLITEDEYKNVKKVLCVLECVRGGLNETELRCILKEDDSDEPMVMMKWALVRRTLLPFLRSSSDQKQEERLDFFHASISEVVRDYFLTDVQQKKTWHLRIADYYQYSSKEDWRASEIIAEQLKEAQDKRRLLEYLKTDMRAKRKSAVWKNQYYKFLMCGQIIPPVKQFSEEVTICGMCSMQHRGFGQIAGLNKDSCVVCGQHVPWKEVKYVAMLCQRHKPFMAPGQKKCYVCDRPAFHNPQKGYTCMVCTSFGIKKCVKFVV